jgi:filamentous hemagglutinin family protein
MNRIYQLVWNPLRQTLVAVSEVSTGRQRGGRSGVAQRAGRVAASASFVLCASAAMAQTVPPTMLPQGGAVSQGVAGIRGAGTATAPVLNIDQTSQRAVINWNSFNLGSAGTVNFNQPGAQSATLNRVLDMNPSQIMGHINAPGQVTLVNPAGVYFGPDAVLDVGALTATAMSQTDADFMAGKARFSRSGNGGGSGKVINEGTLKASGYIALLAPEVRNQGTVTATAVAMASGENIQLNFDAFSRLASLSVTPSQIDALVENRSAVLAPGGLVILSAQALAGLQAAVINSGQIDASSLSARGGRIVLEGDAITLKAGASLNAGGALGGGTVLVGGDWQGSGDMAQATTVLMEGGSRIDASATVLGDGGKVVLWSDVGRDASQTQAHGNITARGGAYGGKGGMVETSGHYLDVSGAKISASAAKGVAGEWLLDPTDITIDDTPTTPGVLDVGNPTYTGTATSTVNAGDIATTLNAGTSVTVQTSSATAGAGNITVNSPTGLTYTGAGTVSLSLKAHNNITLTGSAISSTNGPLNVLLNSNLDAGNLGAIGIDAGSSIVTRGGNITLVGGATGTGSAAASDASHLEGISIAGNLDAGGGNITMRGHGANFATTNNIGILLTNSSIATSGAGFINLDGDAALPIVGGTGNDGIRMTGASLVNTGAGGIALVGATKTGLAGNLGIFGINSNVLAASGAIVIDAKEGGGPSDNFVWQGGNFGLKAGSAVTASSVDITVMGGVIRMPSGVTTFETTGKLVLEPQGTDWDQGVQGTGFFVTPNTVTGLRIGKPTSYNAGVGLGNAVSINGPVAIYGNGVSVAGIASTAAGADVLLSAGISGINMNGPITLTPGGTLTLTASAGAVFQDPSANLTAEKLQLNGPASFNLSLPPNNQIGTLAANGIGPLSFVNNMPLTIGTVGAVAGIGSSSTVNVSTHIGDLTVAQNVATTSASMTLIAGSDKGVGDVTGGNLIFSGGNASVGAGGRALLFSGSISGSTGLTAQVGFGSGRFRYNSRPGSFNFSPGVASLGAGLYALYREAPTVALTVNDFSKPYDAVAFTAAGPAGSFIPTVAPTLYNGDDVSMLFGPTTYTGAAINQVNVGSYALGANVATRLGYVFGYTNGALAITPKGITVHGGRPYDGTLDIAGNILTTMTGLVGTETLDIGGTGAITAGGKDVGTGKTVSTGSLALVDGTNGGLMANYAITGATVDIGKKTITATGSRAYDGTADIVGSVLTSLSGLAGTETVSLSGTGTVAGKDVGVGKLVDVAGYVLADGANGGLAGNYTLTGATADVVKKDISATGSRAYNGNAGIDGSILTNMSGLVGGESLVVGGSGSMADKNVGVGKPVTPPGLTLADGGGGGKAGNYNLKSAAADISGALVNVTAPLVVKTYDGTVSAAGTARVAALAGGAEGDYVAQPVTLFYTDRNAGIGNRTVATTTLTILDATGNDVTFNYSVIYNSNTVSTINRAGLTVSTGDVVKTYDGATIAAGRLLVTGGMLFGTDTLAGGSFAFTNRNAGQGNKTVTVAGVQVADGNSGNNYDVVHVDNTTSTINRAAITVSTTDVTKVHDGNTSAAGTPVVTQRQPGQR